MSAMRVVRFGGAVVALSLVVLCAAYGGFVETAYSDEPHELEDAVVSTDREDEAISMEATVAEVKQALEDPDALILDARPHAHWVWGHIPGAFLASFKDPTVADAIIKARGIENISIIIAYCNGPYCGASKRLVKGLKTLDPATYEKANGHAIDKLVRFQGGTPVWRAVSGRSLQVEADVVRTLWLEDTTAVFFDTRALQAPEIPRTTLLPLNELDAALEDGRLKKDDFNKRIICFGATGDDAKDLADAIARKAFHNVMFFDGTADEFRRAVFAGD